MIILTEFNSKKPIAINPEHVSLITSTYGTYVKITIVTFQDDTLIEVINSFEEVVKKTTYPSRYNHEIDKL